MAELIPFLLRDFRRGRISKNIVSNFLAPENSVSNSINVNFDEIIGSGKVRAGTTKLGETVSENNTPRGLAPFTGPGGNPNLLLAVFADDTSGSIYYYNTNWNLSDKTNLDKDEDNYFAVLGGSAFITNPEDGMFDSSNGNNWGTTNSIPSADVKPALVFRYKGRLLAAGDPQYPDRVFFSSIVDPTLNPFITWDTDPTTGDWIDINPDDGGFVTGFSENSTFVLVFKNTGMYRLDSVSRTADPENIFNVGATKQKAITLCQGVTYYFSGLDIRRTNGGYPEQISRLGVQDFIDAIPLANWDDVCAGNDGLNVYFYIGDVTLNQGQDNQRTYERVALKFSPRDETWSTHSYADVIKFFASYVTFVQSS